MLVFANVLWSLNYATTKYAFGEWLPLAFSATRFLCAGIMFALFVLWREGSLRIRRSDVKLVVATAALGILLNQLTFNYAVDKTTAGNTALILASAPAFAALFASLAGHEHVQRKHWLALAVSVAGVVLVIQGGSGVAGVSLVGDLLAVGAAITWAAYSVMLRPLFGRYSAARISALMVSIGGVMILPFGLPQMHEQDWAGLSGLHWAAWGYSTIFPVLVTNLLYFRALRTIGASRATLYMYLQPFLGALFAAWLLGEQVTGLQILGGAVIVGGVSMGRLLPGVAVPADLVPFALLQVVSGTIGERIGRRRAVRAAYLVYAVALLLAAVAPTIGVFLVSRGLQGTANAFTTPLLLAGLADAVPAGERGRAVGMFAGVQAGGLSLAPLLGGLAAEGSWRLAFILPALVSLGLMLMPPPDPIRAVGEQLPTLRSVATPRMGLLCAAGFAGYLGMAGLAFLIWRRADDAFALGARGRGAVLAVYGAAGLLFGRLGGFGSERLGPARAAVLAAIGCAAMIAPLGIAPSVGTMALLWFAAGAVSALLWAALNTIAVEAVPANRGGAVSLFAAFKFSGTAVAPLAWLPVYDASPGIAFLAAGIVVLAIVPLAPWSLRVP